MRPADLGFLDAEEIGGWKVMSRAFATPLSGPLRGASDGGSMDESSVELWPSGKSLMGRMRFRVAPVWYVRTVSSWPR